MNIKRIMCISFLFCIVMFACNDDDELTMGSFSGKGSKRVKGIMGENNLWGNYRIDFNYDIDGRLKGGIRTNVQTGDTTGRIEVEYDMNYHRLAFIDYMYSIDDEGIERLKEMYPDTWQDSVNSYFVERTLCSVERNGDSLQMHINRPTRDPENTNYVNVSKRTEIMDLNESGYPRVIRCFEDVYGEGADNNTYVRSVYKYTFCYNTGELNTVECYRPDAYSETNFTKLYEYTCTNYLGFLISVDSDIYKMRRDGRTVVIAEPGENTTYTLDEEGYAVKMETTDGENAMFEYENGSGNFYDLFAMPLDRMLGKVWVR